MLPNVEGLHVATGLARLGGNQRLYTRLLLKFAHRHKTTLASIRLALETGDKNRLQVLLGKLMSLAAALGANSIERSARSLAYAATEEIHAHYWNLDRELRGISQRIIQCLTDWTSSTDRGFRPMLSLPQLQDKLKSELRNFDGEALVTWDEFSKRLAGCVPAEELRKINDLVLSLDFQSALSALSTDCCSMCA